MCFKPKYTKDIPCVYYKCMLSTILYRVCVKLFIYSYRCHYTSYYIILLLIYNGFHQLLVLSIWKKCEIEQIFCSIFWKMCLAFCLWYKIYNIYCTIFNIILNVGQRNIMICFPGTAHITFNPHIKFLSVFR